MKYSMIRGSKAKLGKKLALILPFLFAATVCWASGGGGEHGGESGGIAWSSTDWSRVLNFVVLVSVLFFLLRKIVKDALKKRIDDISDELRTLEAKREEAESSLKACLDRVAGLEAETAKIIDSYRKQGEEARIRILEEAKRSAERLELQAKKNIDHEFENARKAIKDEIITEALVKAESIIRTGITSDDQDRLVDEYLKKVVA